MATQKKQLVIIGGGFGGLRAFYNLAGNKNFEITLIDKRDTSSMKPALPEVAFEGKKVESTKIPLKGIVEGKGATYINDTVKLVDGDNNSLDLESGKKVSYDYLVLAPGAYKDFAATKGQDEFAYSMCDDTRAPKLWEALKNFKEGKIVIGAAKSVWGEGTDMKWEAPCEGPIGEALYMIDYYLRKKGIRDKADMKVFAPGAVFRGDAPNLHDSRGIPVVLEHVAKEVKEKSVVFENGEELESDLTIMIPVYRGQDFLIKSGLADSKGMLLTDKEEFRTVKYKNIFGIGDINAVTMPKLGHIAVMQADIVTAVLQNEVGQNVKVPEFKPEIFCIMAMGGMEASVFLTDTAFGGQNHIYWQGKFQGFFKRNFDLYNVLTKGQMPPKIGEHFIKWVVKKLGTGKHD